MLALASLALPITGAIYGVISGALWFCEGMTTLSYLKSNFFADMAYVFGTGSGGSWLIFADGDMIEPDDENGGLQGIYNNFKRVDELYLYISNAVNLYALASNTPINVPLEPLDSIENVTWTATGTNKDKLSVSSRQNMASNYVTATATGLCDVDLQAKIGSRELGHVCIVSAAPLNEPPYAAVAKYDNTFAWRRPTTSDGLRKVSLSATALSSPNLEVIGEHGNFYLVKVWSALDHPIPLHLTTAIKFVEKYKAGKTDPVEKQNISRVVWPATAGSVNSRWGFRTSYNRFHYGVDVNSPNGSSVKAIMDGKVVYRNTLSDRGRVVELEHTIAGLNNKYYTGYYHLSDYSVTYGATVKADSTIGLSGCSTAANSGGSANDTPASQGGAYGYHLHFQIQRNSDRFATSINPLLEYQDTDKRWDKVNPNPFYKESKFNVLFNWRYDDAYYTGTGADWKR